MRQNSAGHPAKRETPAGVAADQVKLERQALRSSKYTTTKRGLRRSIGLPRHVPCPPRARPRRPVAGSCRIPLIRGHHHHHHHRRRRYRRNIEKLCKLDRVPTRFRWWSMDHPCFLLSTTSLHNLPTLNKRRLYNSININKHTSRETVTTMGPGQAEEHHPRPALVPPPFREAVHHPL